MANPTTDLVQASPQGQTGSTRTLQLIVFKVDQQEYGLHIDQIKEVVRTPALTRVPLAPEYISGVANVRGDILALVDLGTRFGLHAKSDAPATFPYTLVVEHPQIKMGVLVSDVPNTLAVPESQVEPTPGMVYESGGDKAYLKGIVRVDTRLIVLIDVFKIFKHDDGLAMATHHATALPTHS